MSHSLRQHAGCVGASGNFSVMRDVLGMLRGRMPPSASGGTTSVSMRQQMDSIKQRHIHVNVIQVGFDAIPAADRPAARDRIDFAVLRTREIFRQVNLGVGRVRHYAITAAQANGLDDLASRSEASDLWNGWSVQNNGVDVFMVRTISASFVGRSPIGGNCNKNGKDSGLIGGRIDRTANGVARTFAHEIGHFLGLKHTHGSNCPTSTAVRNRLMTQTSCAVSTATSTTLNSSEGSTMRGHCSTRGGC